MNNKGKSGKEGPGSATHPVVPVQDHAGVVAPPPVIFVGAMLIGVLLQYVWPLGIVPGVFEKPIGGVLVGVAVVWFVLAVREFLIAKTALPPHRPTSAIVKTGPYRFSRNPIYISLVLFQIGVGVWVNNGWVILMLAPALVLMSYGVIAREERYLARKFGDEYLRYQSSVRRWL